jgi:hypothetical protein
VLLALGLLLLLALAAVVAQLAIPRIAARRVRERLTAAGGEARVEIAALPATRLLRHGGDRIVVRGRGLLLGLAEDATAGEAAAQPGLGVLDGFETVDLELVDFRAGPFAVDAFVLSRAGGGGYAMATRARATPAALAALGLERLPSLPGAGLIGSVAGPIVGDREIPVSVELELVSRDGALEVSAGGGSIAGYPAGPLATAIAASVARRLDLGL